MQTIQTGYKGLSLLFSINWDRMLYVFAIVCSLFLGGLLGGLLVEAVAH